ncbi:S8 family serine peptidase [Falsiroseomonas sp. E2-1-a20]|uniref:S8/S53 family peptidase n=1 Tax=Falsiroseomonas sp. E2-1-a20 TaxID=3239300 RepID=UPI003F2F851E
MAFSMMRRYVFERSAGRFEPRLAAEGQGTVAMSGGNGRRLVLTFRSWPEVRESYEDRNLVGFREALRRQILEWQKRTSKPDDWAVATEFDVLALPSNETAPRGIEIPAELLREYLTVGLVFTGNDAALRFLVASVTGAFGQEASIGADVRVDPAAATALDTFWQHWCPSEASHTLFGTRSAALTTICADPALLAPKGLPGTTRVSLVLVDTGLPLDMLSPIFPGWAVAVGSQVRQPGDPLSAGHGEMVAGNALAATLGTDVLLLDCPAIPDGISNLDVFTVSVTAALLAVLAVVRFRRLEEAQQGLPPSPWVICNAWGVFDPDTQAPSIPYPDNPEHPLANALLLLAAEGVDIIFAAGNCGEFCPHSRCNPAFTGPGRSIHGANALATVLTVGAVRTDGLWLGYSAQGPGIPGMHAEKPDVCAPSQFSHDDDARGNTGTSAACGLAAGAVALFRSKWAPSDINPAELRLVIASTAVQPGGPAGWMGRTGHGIIDVLAAARELSGS